MQVTSVYCCISVDAYSTFCQMIHSTWIQLTVQALQP
jgi:hypothetical protein